ncbi:rhodanese-like domain-containing protein [Methylacidimicrobium tartarophylax]|uniref:Thiosulfate sulfurtransferase GlpE n=1 Tax=Methylacidimicrobium tartarophylax TaxID=1041768 RepID=A0A5E6M626_9BACT|nr:rhodanese-like domain-containing protein [Methylacidimicrobium tartarophylax]VVM04790.1 Thiosulfate sulfurtransferase GlpE [Methylacidimicrobium tartarophylax]
MTTAPRYRLLLDSLRQRVQEISPAQAFHWMREQKGVCIDLRHARQWVAGHLPGAIHVEFGQLPGEIESKIPAGEAPLLCYSRFGERSLIAADLLRQMGSAAAYSLAGGWEAWQQAGLSIEVGAFPSSPLPDERLAGIAQLPHLIDSIRRLSAGLVPSVTPFVRKEDRSVMEFLCIDPQAMEQIVLSADSDADILARLKRELGPSWPSDHAIREFNARVLHRRKTPETTDDS